MEEEQLPPVQVAIVDDQVLFLELLSQKVSEFSQVELVWTAVDGQDALEKIQQETIPDLMLIDYEMPHMNGLELVHHLREHYPDIRTILLSSYDDEQTIFMLFNAGINSYLLKGEPIATIEKAIEVVRNGDQYFPGYVYEALRKMNRREQRRREGDAISAPQLPENPFSKREMQVLVLLCRSLTNAEVAKLLKIAERTVETHRHNIIDKTEAGSLFAVAMLAIKNGWIDLQSNGEEGESGRPSS
jgi:DNA-binding NarL/FixJ family response regulator